METYTNGGAFAVGRDYGNYKTGPFSAPYVAIYATRSLGLPRRFYPHRSGCRRCDLSCFPFLVVYHESGVDGDDSFGQGINRGQPGFAATDGVDANRQLA